MSVSMLIATEILSLLQQLHRVGKVVHGDIHINNIMIEGLDNRNGTISLKFIDYGRSFSNMYRNNQTVRRFGWAHDRQFSSWELEGYDPAPRDDVERAVQVVAQIMMPWSYVEVEQRIGDHSSRSIWEGKRRHNCFVEPRLPGRTGPWYDPVAALEVGEEFKSGIRRNFKIILRLVRGMNDANSVPRYVDLFTGFSATRDLVIGGQTETRRAQLNNTTTTPN